jgi:hypothetical protein
MLKKHIALVFFGGMLAVTACKKDADNGTTDANLNLQFRFDATQPRLNNIGQPAPLPTGHAAQTPDFQELSVHYLELAPGALTLLGKGAIIYKAEETNKGGENAVYFDKALKSDENKVFHNISLKNVPPGTYEWVRASVTYQSYDILFNINKVPVLGDVKNQKGRVASFVGFNTYISSIKPLTKTLTVNDDKKQGFWAFETNLDPQYAAFNNIHFGEAPAGATTVVNPLFATSPIPQGSCVVTGKFDKPLVVTGKETQDITLTFSFSVNKSFEWVDSNPNGQLDFYADQITPPEKIVDMGLRGLIPSWK